MKITPDHVGNIIGLEHPREYVLIESVTKDLVYFRRETGDRYSSFNHEIAGAVLLDEARIEEFNKNSKLGTALNHAEYQAICSLVSSDLTHEQHVDANCVLKTIKSMREHLVKRIIEQNQLDVVKQHRSLDVLILQASGNTHSQESQNCSTLQHQLGSDR